jgi:hypothetical protein
LNATDAGATLPGMSFHRAFPVAAWLAFSALVLSAAIFPAGAMGKFPREKGEVAGEVIASGHCEVPVCTDFDFGDFIFRFYAPNRAPSIRPVPPGACTCKSVVSGEGFNGSLGFTVETADGRKISNVHLARNYSPSEPRGRHLAPIRSILDEFVSEKSNFEPVPDFSRNGVRFAEYEAWGQIKIPPKLERRYYFLPKPPVFVHGFGREHAIAFVSPLGWYPAPNMARTFTLTTQLRVSDNVFYYQFINPDRVPSSDWIATVEAPIPVVEQHIIQK